MRPGIHHTKPETFDPGRYAYRGFDILPCNCVKRTEGRWFILDLSKKLKKRRRGETSTRPGENEMPHFPTIVNAKEHISIILGPRGVEKIEEE